MNASELRLKARQSLKGNYWNAVLMAFLAAIFGALIVNGGTFDLDFKQEVPTVLQDLPKIVARVLLAVIGTFSALSLVHLILGGVVQLGYAQYLLKQQDREISAVKDLFSQFDRFKDGFLQLFLRKLFVALWSLLLVIPGIYKSFAYSMTPFLMAEDPTLSARAAMRLSEEKMDGHKRELFCLELSFIGWILLAVITFGVGEIFLAPYMNAAFAAFYRDKISPKTATVSYTYIDAQN